MTMGNPIGENKSPEGLEVIITEEGGHLKARIGRPEDYPERFPVPDGKVDWQEDFPGYRPKIYTADKVIMANKNIKSGGWADPPLFDKEKMPLRSFFGEIKFDSIGLPLNPRGRTGIEGRGLLGKWGPNFAADPLVTKMVDGKVYLWSVLRKSGDWAIPGGMVEYGDTVTKTFSKELKEETGMELDFNKAPIIYEGYVDDPRNTDNAWVETTVAHIKLPETVKIKIGEGKDEKTETKGKAWKELTPEFIKSMYASHGKFVELALKNL